ncbi:FecR family protein [Zhouia sp. PK063]|uniref:FecR family protein n=1 Tax=Zhouia sp. PK063 TaxID=3373602 RepID=UPI0037B0AEA1
MVPNQIEHIIIKYLNGHTSIAEELDLIRWLDDEMNNKIFEKYVENYFLINSQINPYNVNDAKNVFFKKINTVKKQELKSKKRKKYFSYLKIAAVFIGVFGLGLTTYYKFYKQELIIPNDVITLQMEDGSVKTIKITDSLLIKQSNGVIGIQKGNVISYNAAVASTHDLASNEVKYNTIKVPYGKKFNVLLADSSYVYLNSGSSLKYPVAFRGKLREVYLKGEAYFKVAHDKEHPFIVNTGEMNVRVLGTQFNVSAYEEDHVMDVALVRGSVRMDREVNGDKTETLLKPGNLGEFDRVDKSVNVSDANMNLYTAWLNGDLVFRDEKFSNIIKKLDRAYNVEIVNNNAVLANQYFNANINVYKSDIYEVLEFFSNIYEIKYEVKNNRIIIK